MTTVCTTLYNEWNSRPDDYFTIVYARWNIKADTRSCADWHIDELRKIYDATRTNSRHCVRAILRRGVHK
jgi:hypothetical protein